MITQFNRDNLAQNLPDAYRKDADSNISKILQIEKAEMDRLRADMLAVYDALDLNKAHGKTLDLYGSAVGQERGRATDNQYRVLIKARILRNFANGDHGSIVNLLAMIFDCNPEEILLTELEAPCEVRVDRLPFTALNNMALDINTVLKIVREVIPAGVYMGSVAFTGTFEFSAGTELVYDDKKGFADTAQTFGGTLGYIFNEEPTDLPV